MIMGEEYELGKKVGVIESDETVRRVFKFFLDNENQEAYHGGIHRSVRGSKTGISRALHILDADLEVMDKKYIQIPKPDNPSKTISVLMFKLKPEFYETIRKTLN